MPEKLIPGLLANERQILQQGLRRHVRRAGRRGVHHASVRSRGGVETEDAWAALALGLPRDFIGALRIHSWFLIPAAGQVFAGLPVRFADREGDQQRSRGGSVERIE